jgi:hypothetical protein
MVKKTMTVAAVAAAFLLLGGTNAFAAAGVEQCMADDVASVSLASTGAGLDVQAWLIAGIALLAIGATLAIVSPRRRRPAEVPSIEA